MMETASSKPAWDARHYVSARQANCAATYTQPSPAKRTDPQQQLAHRARRDARIVRLERRVVEAGQVVEIGERKADLRRVHRRVRPRRRGAATGARGGLGRGEGAHRRKHADAAVLQLSLAKPVLCAPGELSGGRRGGGLNRPITRADALRAMVHDRSGIGMASADG